MNFTQEQLDILNANEDKIAIDACAASAKTATLTEKVRKVLKSGVKPYKIACITFTRMAAEEMRQRLGEDNDNEMFVGTIHSLAAHFISEAGFGFKISAIAEEEKFDELFKICDRLNISNEFDYVFLDEAQDSGRLELSFVFDKMRPKHLLVVYDLKQVLYEFKGATPQLLVSYLEKNNFKYYPLSINFRNSQNIHLYAKTYINRGYLQDNSKTARTEEGLVQRIAYNEKGIMDLIRSTDNYGDWAILVRYNNQLDTISKQLTRNGIPFDTFRQGDLTKDQLNTKLNANSVKLLTIHSSKGLAFNNVLTYGVLSHNQSEMCCSYVAFTRAKNRLYIGYGPLEPKRSIKIKKFDFSEK